MSLKQNPKKKSSKKVHQWRVCPAGEHWVNTHPRIKPVNPGKTRVSGHCRLNPSKKDQFYPEEMALLAEKYFKKIKNKPKDDPLDRKNGNEYDLYIAGWTQYWNDVFRPDETLDPNLVKALIRTESDFKPNAKALASKGNWARGLMQVTDETLEILQNEKGELRDHLLNINQNKIADPNLNIAAGTRWLFQKKKLLESKKKRKVTWAEVVYDYKGYTKKIKSGQKSALTQKQKFDSLYERLKK